jgi:hypothetical protein
MYELKLNDFIHGGVKITGFSIVDYYNWNIMKMISDLTETSNPLNKVDNIPVSYKFTTKIFYKKYLNVLNSSMKLLY